MDVLGLGLPFLLHYFILESRGAADTIALAGADPMMILLNFNLARWLLARTGEMDNGRTK